MVPCTACTIKTSQTLLQVQEDDQSSLPMSQVASLDTVPVICCVALQEKIDKWARNRRTCQGSNRWVVNPECHELEKCAHTHTHLYSLCSLDSLCSLLCPLSLYSVYSLYSLCLLSLLCSLYSALSSLLSLLCPRSSSLLSHLLSPRLPPLLYSALLCSPCSPLLSSAQLCSALWSIAVPPSLPASLAIAVRQSLRAWMHGWMAGWVGACVRAWVGGWVGACIQACVCDDMNGCNVLACATDDR